MDNVFIRALLTDKVKLKPNQVTKEYAKYILNKLRATYEAKCTYHGYIKPKSIEVSKISVGKSIDGSLNGDAMFNVVYYADVCNPTVGSTVKAKVVNTNMFGILAENGVDIDGTFYPILEIIVAKNSSVKSDVDLEKIKIGDVVNIEVVGKKFELNDLKITVVGKVIENQKQKKELDGGNVFGHTSDNEEEDAEFEEEEVEEEENEDEEDEDEESDDGISSYADDDEGSLSGGSCSGCSDVESD